MVVKSLWKKNIFSEFTHFFLNNDLTNDLTN